MRIALLLILGSIISGIIAGWGWTRLETGPPGTLPPNIRREAGLYSGADRPLPKGEIVGGTVYDFGIMELGTSQRHKFTVKNNGTAALTLRIAGTSCRCTLAELPQNQLAPQAETTIELEWKATDKQGPFSQTATIETNDPRLPVVILGVKGRVVGSHYVEPNELILTKIANGQSATAEFRVWCYTTADLPIPGNLEWSPSEQQQFFRVEFQPVEKAELQREDRPLAGYRGRVTVLPGLPLGEFRQTLVFDLKTGKDITAKIEIRGLIEGGAALLGTTGWDIERNILDWGTVTRGQVARSPVVKLILLGDQTKELKPRVSELNLSWLQVEFGQAEYIPGLNQTHLPITLIVPADAPVARHSGQANEKLLRIAIDPGIDNQPKVRMFVRLTVE